MTDIFLLMWLADIVNQLSIVLCTIAIFVLMVVFFFTVEGTMNRNDKGIPTAKKGACIVATLFLVCTLLPTKTTIHVMVAASATEALANTELGQKSIAAINVILDDIIVNKSK